MRTWKRTSITGVLSAALVVALAGGAVAQSPAPTPTPAPSFETQPGAVTLVAYSTPREAFETLIEQFQATEAGAGVEFETSFGASGTRAARSPPACPPTSWTSPWSRTSRAWSTRASSPPTGTAMSTPASSPTAWWSSRPAPATPRTSRAGTTSSATTSSVITPNPFTSGGAMWNIMAAYGAQIKAGKTEAEALDYLAKLFAHVSVLDKSARESLQTFLAGQGDVLITYENEAIIAQQKGEDLPYVVPDATILIENPAAVTLNGDAPDAAKAFLDYLYTPEGQAVFGDKGYRPVVAEVAADLHLPGAREPVHDRRLRRLG